jgi:hypothetical protein
MLLDYLEKTRMRFMGLLVAVRWASDKHDLLTKLSGLMGKLHEMQVVLLFVGVGVGVVSVVVVSVVAVVVVDVC